MVSLLVHCGMAPVLGVLDIEAHHHYPEFPVNKNITDKQHSFTAICNYRNLSYYFMRTECKILFLFPVYRSLEIKKSPWLELIYHN
jgi:hypothetical protein